MLRGLRDRIGIGDAGAIETECTSFIGERGIQVGGRKLEGRVQKSRST
jgi:hypothetical protein